MKDRETAPQSNRLESSKEAQTEEPVTKPRFEDLPPAAQRALKEAEARRSEQYGTAPDGPKEINGRKGPEPVRYGDWEKDGIISDF